MPDAIRATAAEILSDNGRHSKADAVHQFKTAKRRLDKILPAKNNSNEVLCWPIWRARDGISSEHPAAVALVIFQNRVRLHRQRVAVMRSGIYIDRDHVRPLFEIVLICRREFVSIFLRPPVEITDAPEHERGLVCCSGM